MNSTLLNQTCSPTSSVERMMYPAAYSLFFIVGFPASLLSLYAAIRLMLNGNTMLIYFINLCITDLLYIVSLPVWIEMALHRSITDDFCSFVYVIMYNSFYVGSGLLCCISVDRCLAIVYPLHFHWVRKMRTAVIVSTAVWILEILFHLLLLHHMGALKSFSYLCHQNIPMQQTDANTALARVLMSFLVPVIIMTFCYHQIMQSLQQSSSILAEERRKVGRLLLFLFLTYLASFMPYQTVMFLRAMLEPGDCGWAAILRDPYLVTVATTTLNSTLDPIIYCLINESAKAEIRKVVEKGRESFIKRKNSPGIQTVS